MKLACCKACRKRNFERRLESLCRGSRDTAVGSFPGKPGCWPWQDNVLTFRPAIPSQIESSKRQFPACTSRRPGLPQSGVMVRVLANAHQGSGHAKGLAWKAEHLHRIPLSPASKGVVRDPSEQRARLVRSQQAYSLQTTLPRLRKNEWAARLVCRAGSAAVDAGAWDAAGGDRDPVAAAAVEEVHSLVWDFPWPSQWFP